MTSEVYARRGEAAPVLTREAAQASGRGPVRRLSSNYAKQHMQEEEEEEGAWMSGATGAAVEPQSSDPSGFEKHPQNSGSSSSRSSGGAPRAA